MSPRRSITASAPANALPAGVLAGEQAERESRKEAIVDAAAEIFHRKGYHATSIQDIAEEVGMLKGSLYYYIDSKHDLLLEILTDVHTQAFARLQEVVDAESSAPDRLRAFIVNHAIYCSNHLTGMGVFLHEYKAVAEPARAAVIEMRDRYETLLRQLIQSGQEDGSFRADADARLTTKLVLGIVNWLYQWYSPGGRLSAEEIGQAMADMALRGLES